MLKLIKTETVLQTDINLKKDISVLIFTDDNYLVTLLEKTMLNWVESAVEGYSVKVVKFNEKQTEISQIKKNLAKTKYMLVLYSFNPLLTNKNLAVCLDYLILKDENLIKLPFGYVFKTEYFKKVKEIKEPLLFSGDKSEFLKISSEAEIGYAAEVLQRRIINNHILNGVKFLNPQSVVVNANVLIEPNVTIYSFNTLSGETHIKKGAILKEGNTIINSEIGANTAVANSIITDSTISSNSVIFPFNTIEQNSFIGANCVIKSYNKIVNACINENTTVESFNDIGC